MGNVRRVTVNSVSPTQIITSVPCTDVFTGEDPLVSGASFPSSGLLIFKGSLASNPRGLNPGSMYQFSQKSPGPSGANGNFGIVPGYYPPNYLVGWVQAAVGSISVFIDEEGAS